MAQVHLHEKPKDICDESMMTDIGTVFLLISMILISEEAGGRGSRGDDRQGLLVLMKGLVGAQAPGHGHCDESFSWTLSWSWAFIPNVLFCLPSSSPAAAQQQTRSRSDQQQTSSRPAADQQQTR